jgi:predicted  nucleic acid-binding Zn-ribbon protein
MARKRRAKARSAAPSFEAEARALGKRIDALIGRARRTEAGARANAMRQIRGLQKQQAAAQRALAKLGRQGAAASEPILVGLQKAWRDIELAVRHAAKRFRETG